MQMLFHKKQRTPLGFCDGLDNVFVGFGSKDEKGCRPPKYHASYAPYYPIHKAASMGDVNTVKSFVERGVFAMEQTDWKYRTALHFACVYGHPEVVTLLVESSCEISPKDIKDATPLIKASQCRQTECLNILLKHGADPNIMDCSDNTALHYAVYNGDIETATKLLEYKANIEAINENKITPLLLALKQNKEKMAEFLIHNGANAKTCDFLGRSSLMYAVRCGSELIIKLLLQRDIDTFKQDVFGWTAKRYAVESKSRVRKLLIDYDEEELRQRCSEITRKDACTRPILPTVKVKDSPRSEAVEKAEARPSKSESNEEDTCTTPTLPTTKVKDPSQSEAVEKAEARPSKSESAETDACPTPNTQVEDFSQNVAAEEAGAHPSRSEPGLGVSSEKKANTSDHNENSRSLDSHNSGDQEENSKDITKRRVLDLSAEVVIEVSSEEEQKGDDKDGDDGDDEDGDDGDDEDGDDGDDDDGDDSDDEDGDEDKDGAGHQKHMEEESQQPAGKSNQENPSHKPSAFQEGKDTAEDSEDVTTEQPLGKDEEPKSQRDSDSDRTTEEEATKEPLGQDKTPISRTVEDSPEDSEEEARKQPVEKSNKESHCQKTNNDKKFSQILEDSSMESEEEAPEQPVERSNQGSPYKKSILQKSEDSSGDSEGIFECLTKKGISHLHGASGQTGDQHIKESPKKCLLFKPTTEMNDSGPKNALEMTDAQALPSEHGQGANNHSPENSDLEVTSSESEKSQSDSTINSPLTVFKYLPRKEENAYLTGSTLLQGQHTATGQMKAESEAEDTSTEEARSDDGSESTQAFSISETYGLKKILGYLRRISDQQAQKVATGRMTAEVKKMMSRDEQSHSESSVSDHSWTFSDLPQRVDVNPLIRSRDQMGENTARGELKGKGVTAIGKLRRPSSRASVDSLSTSERPSQEQAVGHMSETADPRRENTGKGEMKVFSDFSKESPPQLKPTVKRKSSFLNRAVAKRQERSWEPEPDKELTSTEEQKKRAISERSESLKEDVEHLTGAGGQGRENQARYTMGALRKEVTEERRRHDSQKNFQSLVIPKPHPLSEDIICLTGIPVQERENKFNMETKAVSSTEVTSTEEHTTDNSFGSTDSMLMSECLLQKKDVNHLPWIVDERTKAIISGAMKGSPKEYPPQFKERRSVFGYTAVVGTHANTNESEESGKEETSVEGLTRHGSLQSIQSWTTSETFSKENDVVHLARITDERPENITNAEVKAIPDKEIIWSEQQRHDNHGNARSLTTSETSTYMEDVVSFSVTTDRLLENMANAETKAKPANKVISTEGQTRAYNKERPGKEDVCHLAVSIEKRSEALTRGETEDLCKEASLTKEQRRHSIHGCVQTLMICEPFPQQKNVSHLGVSTDQRIESKGTREMKAKPDRGIMTSTKEQRRRESTEKLRRPANSERLPQKSIVNHLVASEHQRKENMTNGEKEATNTEMASTDKPRKSNENEKVLTLIISALRSTRDNPGHLDNTVHQRKENDTSLEMNAEPGEVVKSTEKQRKHDSQEEVQSLIISECLPQKHDTIDLALTTDQRRQNNTTIEKKGPCYEETSTEDDQNCDSHIVSEPLAQKDIAHLPEIADQRGENVASGRTKEKPNLYVKSRDQNGGNGSENSQPLLKQKRKTGLSNKMDAVGKSSYDNTTAGAAGGDGDNAAAISYNGVKDGVTQQMHYGKACDHQFSVTQREHVGLNKKTSDGKNKALKYMDSMDDQLSESLSEDDDLPDYDNILMIVNQLQMNYKDSGKPLEIQDAVQSYKMIMERNQSHSELLIEKSKSKRNQGSEALRKPRGTEKAELQLGSKNEEQQLDLIDVGSAEKQEVQQRNADSCYEKMKKQLTEKEQQYTREKQQFELRLRAQDMELQRLRNDINKLKEAQRPETEAEHGDSKMKEHLQKVEHEVSKLVETIKKQTETIEQLERKPPSEDRTLVGTGNLTQAGQEFSNANREMYTSSVMNQLELRIQHLERAFSEMKAQAREDDMVLEKYIKIFQSHKLMETEAKLKEVKTQFVLLNQHNTALLSMLSSAIASEGPRMANFHRELARLFTQENTLIPTSDPQPSNQSVTAHLDAPELHQKRKCLESAKEKTPSKNCFKPTKTSTAYENGDHSFSELSNARQFEMNIPTDEPQHKITREDQETFDNVLGNHNALFINPWEFRCTNLESEHSDRTTHLDLYKAESKQCKDPCLEWVAMTNSSSQGRRRSKHRQDRSMRRKFNKVESYSSALNMCVMNSAPGFESGQLYNSLGYSRDFLQREPLMTSSRSQPFESSLSYLNRMKAGNGETFHDVLKTQNTSFNSPQELSFTNLQPEWPEEMACQTSYKAKPKPHEDSYPERLEKRNSPPPEQLKFKERQDGVVRKAFGEMEANGSAPNVYTPSPVAGLTASGCFYNNSGHSRRIRERESLIPSLGPQRTAESVVSFASRGRKENPQTSYDNVGNHKASHIKSQISTVSNLQSKCPELTHQTSYNAEPNHYEDPYAERIEMTKLLTYDQLRSKDRRNESMRRNVDKMEAYSSVPNMFTKTSPAPGFGSEQPYSNLEHSMQREAKKPSSRPWHFMESLDSYLSRTWQQLYDQS
nr:ankyrin repeat domain-containing protein 26-like isoform X9 [Rattus norvegicus]